jgi:hypothetical protein
MTSYTVMRTVDSKKGTVLAKRLSDGLCAIVKARYLAPFAPDTPELNIHKAASRMSALRLNYTTAWLPPENYKEIIE